MELKVIYFARIWKSGGVCTHILKGHSDAVTSICYLKPKGKMTIWKLLLLFSYTLRSNVTKSCRCSDFYEPGNQKTYYWRVLPSLNYSWINSRKEEADNVIP